MNLPSPQQVPSRQFDPEQERREGVESFSHALRLVIICCYIVAVIMVLVIAAQSFLIVKDHEIAFIYQFGTLRGIVGTGLHFTWPYPIEETEVYQVTRAKQIESKIFLAKPTESVPDALKPGVDGYLFTGDQNIIQAKCVLTYYVDRKSQAALLNYFVNNSDSKKQLKLLFENAVLKTAASMSADEMLFDVDLFRSRVASCLRKNIAESGIGIIFETKDISVTTKPPAQAKTAFNALNQANIRVDKLRTDALTYKIKTVKAAESQADQIVANAKSGYIEKISAAKADAATFTLKLAQFKQTPKLIIKTIYEETMFRIFENIKEKFVIRKDSKGEIRVLLSRNLGKRKSDDEENK